MIAVVLLPLWDRPDRPPATTALAATSAPPATVGGLMPGATVTVNGSPRALRDIRPAMFFVVGVDCRGCEQSAAGVAAAADAVNLRTLVAGVPSARGEVVAVAGGIAAPWVEMPPGVLADFGSATPFVVAVGSDGVIVDITPVAQGQSLATAARDAAEQSG